MPEPDDALAQLRAALPARPAADDHMRIHATALRTVLDQLAQADSIVRDLAAMDSSLYADETWCRLCASPEHTEACPWRRATTYTETHTSEGE